MALTSLSKRSIRFSALVHNQERWLLPQTQKYLQELLAPQLHPHHQHHHNHHHHQQSHFLCHIPNQTHIILYKQQTYALHVDGDIPSTICL